MGDADAGVLEETQVVLQLDQYDVTYDLSSGEISVHWNILFMTIPAVAIGGQVSPFINNLPFGKGTQHFSTENASGSTSQAANIMEALEVGCRLLLIDEDTSATNFMIRDARMQRLVGKLREPITPFVDKVAALYRQQQASP